MPILNKDGSPFRLQGPNPLMNNQDRWDLEQVTYHNFHWENIIFSNKEPEPIPAPRPEVPEQEPPKPAPKPEISELKPEIPEKTSIKVHCLLGLRTTIRDELYDEEKIQITYGDNFLFDAMTESRNDLSLVLWTAQKSITPGSILFPKTGHARWWRVESVEGTGIGFHLICSPSDLQPSFPAQP